MLSIGLLCEQGISRDSNVQRALGHNASLCEEQTVSQVHVVKRSSHANDIELKELGALADVRLLQIGNQRICGLSLLLSTVQCSQTWSHKLNSNGKGLVLDLIDGDDRDQSFLCLVFLALRN